MIVLNHVGNPRTLATPAHRKLNQKDQQCQWEKTAIFLQFFVNAFFISFFKYFLTSKISDINISACSACKRNFQKPALLSSLIVHRLLCCKELLEKRKLVSFAGRRSGSSDAASIACPNRRNSLSHMLGRGRRWEGEEESIEHAYYLAEAWPGIWVLNPARLHDKHQLWGYIFWKRRSYLLSGFPKSTIQIRL